MNKIEQATQRGRALLDLAGLQEWNIETFMDYHRLARTNYFNKTIFYNERFIQRCTEDEFDQVTVHEIAHALVGQGNGHNKKFVDVCRKIFPSNPACEFELDIDIHRYDLTCPKCGGVGSTNDNRKRYCGSCLVPWKRTKFIVPTTVWASTQ